MTTRDRELDFVTDELIRHCEKWCGASQDREFTLSFRENELTARLHERRDTKWNVVTLTIDTRRVDGALIDTLFKITAAELDKL